MTQGYSNFGKIRTAPNFQKQIEIFIAFMTTNDQYKKILQEFYESLTLDELLLVVFHRDIMNPLTKDAKKIAESTLLTFGRSQEEMLTRHQEIMCDEKFEKNPKTRIGEQWFYDLWVEDQNFHLRISAQTDPTSDLQRRRNISEFYDEYVERESIARTSVSEDKDDEADAIIHYGKYLRKDDSSRT
jgi:hypothetical protein